MCNTGRLEMPLNISLLHLTFTLIIAQDSIHCSNGFPPKHLKFKLTDRPFNIQWVPSSLYTSPSHTHPLRLGYKLILSSLSWALKEKKQIILLVTIPHHFLKQQFLILSLFPRTPSLQHHYYVYTDYYRINMWMHWFVEILI